MTITDIELRVDPEFESKIPPLTDDEYRQLEENILSEGAVLMPLIVWNCTIVDGHNRYKILRENPGTTFTVHEKKFNNRYEALLFAQQTGFAAKVYPRRKDPHTEALCLIAAAWKGHKDSMKTETIQGMIGFVDMYHDEYDPKRLVSRCQRFDPMHICRCAKAAGDALSAPQRYIFEVWKMYNGSSRSHTLPLKF